MKKVFRILFQKIIEIINRLSFAVKLPKRGEDPKKILTNSVEKVLDTFQVAFKSKHSKGLGVPYPPGYSPKDFYKLPDEAAQIEYLEKHLSEQYLQDCRDAIKNHCNRFPPETGLGLGFNTKKNKRYYDQIEGHYNPFSRQIVVFKVREGTRRLWSYRRMTPSQAHLWETEKKVKFTGKP